MDNTFPSPQNNDEPQPDPGTKTGYPVLGADAPGVNDEPEEEIVKTQYPVEAE